VSVQQGSNALAPSVDTYNAGDGNLNLRLTTSATWLAASFGEPRECPLGQRCTPINIDLRTSALQRGTYTGLITVSDPGAIDAPQTIAVTVQVGGGVPDRADLYVAPNGSSTELRFSTNSPLQSSVTTQSGGEWLALSSEGSGSFRFGVTVPHRIIATHRSGLGEGAYNGEVRISGSNVAAENKAVPVTLRVTSQPIAELSSERLSFRIAQGSASQSLPLVATNRGLGTLTVSGATSSTASGGNWLTAQTTGNVVMLTANPTGVAPGSYTGSVAIASNAAQGSITVPVTLDIVAAGPPLAFYQGAVNNATFEAGDFLAQGGIVALYGEQFTTGEARTTPGVPWPTDLGGARVFVNGQPAPLHYVSYGQINFLVPYDAQPGTAVIRVERDGQRGNDISARLVRGAPRIMRLGIANYGIIVNQDGSFPIPTVAGISSRPARAGETLVMYALGLGPTLPAVTTGAASPSSPLAGAQGNYSVVFGTSSPFGGEEAVAVPPLFAGLTPGFVGLYQVNVTIPQDAPKGSAIPVTLLSYDGRSNSVTIAIE
jgi:uncharacterized protein (TIGR03437 family)